MTGFSIGGRTADAVEGDLYDGRAPAVHDGVTGGEDCRSSVCARYGISRKTGYKWAGRYAADPLERIPIGRNR